MSSAATDWSSLFLPSAARGETDCEIEIDEPADDLVEVTGDMLVAMPETDDPDDEVTEPLPELAGEDEVEAWPRSFEEHLREVKRVARSEDALDALTAFGLSDVRGCEECAAAIAKAWEDLRFWEPMLEIGRSGEFAGHLADLGKCQALLEAHAPPAARADILERWEQARAALRRALPEPRVPPSRRAELLSRLGPGAKSRARVTVDGEA